MYRKDCVVLERRPSLHCAQKGLCCFRGEAQYSFCTEDCVVLFFIVYREDCVVLVFIVYRKECVVLESSLCTERTVLFLSLHCVQKGLCCFRVIICTERTAVLERSPVFTVYREDCVVLERWPSLHCVPKRLCCFREEAQSSLCTERTVLF